MNTLSRISSISAALQPSALRPSARPVNAAEDRARAGRLDGRPIGTGQPGGQARAHGAANGQAQAGFPAQGPTDRYTRTASGYLLDLMINRMGGALDSTTKGSYVDLKI